MDVNDLGKHNRWECPCDSAYGFMHDSHLPLRKWFLAIYLMFQEGHEPNQLKRGRLLQDRLVSLSHPGRGNDPFTGPTLFGIVEVDETLVGGKTKGKGRAYKGNKTWVAGATSVAETSAFPDVTGRPFTPSSVGPLGTKLRPSTLTTSNPTSGSVTATPAMRPSITLPKSGPLVTCIQTASKECGASSSVPSSEPSTR